MFCLNDTNCFTLSRGDTFKFPIIINSNTKLNFEKYILTENDTIYGAILEPGQPFENAIIRKVITKESDTDSEGNVLFILNSSDTEYLLTGKYYFTLKLKDEYNNIITILPMKEFWITGTSKEPCNCASCI